MLFNQFVVCGLRFVVCGLRFAVCAASYLNLLHVNFAVNHAVQQRRNEGGGVSANVSSVEHEAGRFDVECKMRYAVVGKNAGGKKNV